MVHNEQANQLVGTALGHINLGELFQAQERFDEALAEYRLAYDALNGSTDELHWMDAAFNIANIHIREGRPAQAAPYIEEGLRKAREIHSLRHLSRGYQLYSNYNYGRGDYRRAVDDLRRVQAYNDTIRQNQESERLLESRIAHENELHTREIEERDRNAREHELRSRNRSLQFLALLAALLAVMVVLIHKRRMAHRQSAEVQKLERMRSNLFTRMTHEFRTPLTTIIGNSDLLLKKYNGRESADPADVDKYGTIIRNGNTLLKLVDGLLEFSRSESGNNKLMWRHGDLAAFVRAVAEPYEKSAQDKNINLSVVSDTNKLEMNYAPEGIVSVFRNLLSNAIRHTPSGGRIEVLLRHDRRSKRCVITIRDNGEGISPENLPNIFELYYTSDIDGMGIGLAHTKQLVEEMSGTIGVISTHGRGTEFTVSLPIALMEIPEDRRATPSDNFTHHVPDNETDEIKRYGNPDPEEIENDNRSVILVVEDNRDVANYIRNVLGDGYIILHALNGVEGFDMAEKYVPDLIITDLMMPQKDGYALTADIRASVVASHIPIIMLTAKATGDDRKEGFKAGADAYLFKPFDEEELLVRVKQMLDSRAKLREIYSGAVLTGGFDSTASDKIADNDKDFIAHLSMVIGSHIDDEDYFPGKLSQEMCLSVSQLNRKLKTMTGNTLSSFVMDARLRRAKLLLSKGGQSIKEVAFACGFSDLGYFSRSFKNAFGCAPSQFSKTAIK
jgi:signal transduction histidine kinase/AraC-like DNA-binding protein/ActR/RegA family two-component response regulator